MGPRPYAIMDRPLSLTSRINPRLGVSSQSQRLRMYALDGFLAPSSWTQVLTRILRHLLNFQNNSGYITTVLSVKAIDYIIS